MPGSLLGNARYRLLRPAHSRGEGDAGAQDAAGARGPLQHRLCPGRERGKRLGVAQTRDTVFFDLRTPEEKVMLALKMLLVRVDLSNIAFVLDVSEESVLEWLKRAIPSSSTCALPRRR